LQIGEAAGRHQEEKLARLRKRRDNGRVRKSLDALSRAAEGTENTKPENAKPENTMPYILDAVKAYATLGEICGALRAVFGVYQETARL